ncbi:MAG: haloacid dehalogenase [Chloroflexi bacterium]|nr:MAG: haloacid dehalogenase [Chloroflexota bacterium]
MRYAAVGFDLLTALLDTWSLWSEVAGDRELGMRWHAASQELLRGKRYRPFVEVVREAATQVGLESKHPAELLRRWGHDFAPWPDVPPVLERLDGTRRFIVTNCSRKLGRLAAFRAGRFELVVTAEEAGAYKPDPLPYRMALDRLGLDSAEVLFVAGSAHDVGGAARVGMDVYWANRGGAPAPTDGAALREEPDFRGLLETLGWDPHSGAGGQSPPSSW